jgi:two-component system response regulator YesN
MILSRLDFRWRVLAFGHVVHDCLESLALKQGYRVDGVCRELGLSESYFREIFLRDVGLTPRDWMQWERMVVARRMLVWGIDPLVIADTLGFSHLNSFRREFREVYGVSPVRFQERKRGEGG